MRDQAGALSPPAFGAILATMDTTVFNLAALAALVPLAILPYSRRRAAEGDPRDLVFWAVLAAALAGAGAWTWATFAPGWQAGMAATLWITMASALVLFALFSAASDGFARLLPLFGPYLVLMGAIATIWAHAPARHVPPSGAGAWLGLHIVVSIATYALVTLAAVAALGVYLQERALKARAPTRLTAMLPPVAEGEALQLRLLAASAVVLGLGLATGLVTEAVDGRPLFPITHKTLLTVLSFAVIVALLAVHRASGLAGRLAARYVLVAYLLLTLGYPGVKFVTDVILR